MGALCCAWGYAQRRKRIAIVRIFLPLHAAVARCRCTPPLFVSSRTTILLLWVPFVARGDTRNGGKELP
ncbi:MAG: hypothetical protein RMJ87_09710, partial [Cytophagales bacterium]|nr:hypothetical protein [Cytophagales bacterium]